MAHLLVLSDDARAREQAVLALEKTNHEVFATGGADIRRGAAGAFAKTIRSFKPELIIIDLDVLSRVSESTERLLDALQPERATGQGGAATAVRAPAVLVLIPLGHEGQIIPSFEAGADDYALKPIDPKELRTKVEILLGSRASKRPIVRDAETEHLSISDDGKLQNQEGEDFAGDVPGALGRYDVLGILGKGGYGTVYRARDLGRDGRPCALKVLPAQATQNAEAVARFFRESAAIARVDHPNIVRFYELGSVKGRFYFTMELVEGTTLKQIVEAESPLPEPRAAHFVAQAASALSALSSLGFVHRDIKPENMVVLPDDRMKLIDFGLVKITDTATITSADDVLGTPYFMAPEYISAACRPDVRYDIYSLGVTFFNMLTGEYPFEGKNAAHVMEKHLREAPPAPSARNPRVTTACDRLVLRMLEKDPKKRPQSADELIAGLRPLLAPS
jgi:DNA-binding response OmpR family regulator/predicted Ser/Thr protein kinase